MNYIKHLSAFFNKIVHDTDLNPTHVSLYMALFQSWNLNRFQNPISITRNEVMRISKIFSKATYHKCVNELHQKGYIIYEPSHNPFKGSLVYVIELENNKLPITKKEQRNTKNRQLIEHPIEQVLNNFQTTTFPTPRQALVPSINNTNNPNISKSANGHSLDEKTIEAIEEPELNNHPKEKQKKFREKKEIDIAEIIPPNIEDVKTFFIAMNTEETEAERFFNHFQSNGWLVGGKSKMKNWQAAAKNWIMNLQSFIPVQVAAATPMPGNLKTSNQKKYDEPL